MNRNITYMHKEVRITDEVKKTREDFGINSKK